MCELGPLSLKNLAIELSWPGGSGGHVISMVVGSGCVVGFSRLS